MGRPRSFNPDDALQRAMECFWHQGFDSTSLTDLVDATGASRASLYQLWGDKQGIYLAAMQHYADTIGTAALEELERGEPLAAIRAYVTQLGELVAEGHGCFVVGTVMDPACAAQPFGTLTRAQLDRVEAALHDALLRAQVPDAHDHARHLAVSLQGLLMQGRARPPKPTIDAFVRITLATLPESP